MANMRVRMAELQDATRLAELSKVLGYPVEAEQLADRLETILRKKEHAVFVAITPTDSVVGWIHATEQLVLESGPSCEILGLVVDANQRGHGIGRLLVGQVEEWAIDRGLRQITVRSNIIRVESHPFYERLGFARVKTQHAYRKELT